MRTKGAWRCTQASRSSQTEGSGACPPSSGSDLTVLRSTTSLRPPNLLFLLKSRLQWGAFSCLCLRPDHNSWLLLLLHRYLNDGPLAILTLEYFSNLPLGRQPVLTGVCAHSLPGQRPPYWALTLLFQVSNIHWFSNLADKTRRSSAPFHLQEIDMGSWRLLCVSNQMAEGKGGWGTQETLPDVYTAMSPCTLLGSPRVGALCAGLRRVSCQGSGKQKIGWMSLIIQIK